MPDLYPAIVRNKIIILNIRDNKFYILSSADSEILLKCYSGESDRNVTFMGYKLLSEFYSEHDEYSLFNKRDNLGINTNFWSLKYSDVSFEKLSVIISLIKSLHISHNLLKSGLFFTINNLIKKQGNAKNKELNIPQIIKYLNAATMIYGPKTKCLEWSVALLHYIIQFGYKPTLKIGVQNNPFYSHSWVEFDGEIIGDIKDLNERMVVIFKFDFEDKNDKYNSIL